MDGSKDIKLLKNTHITHIKTNVQHQHRNWDLSFCPFTRPPGLIEVVGYKSVKELLLGCISYTRVPLFQLNSFQESVVYFIFFPHFFALAVVSRCQICVMF